MATGTYRNRSLVWWYWLAADLLLVYGLLGGTWGFFPVIALAGVQAVHVLLRERRVSAFPVLVRLAFLGLLLFGQWEYGYFMYFIQLAGTTAMVLVNYCPLARFLSLLPWNRNQPLTWQLMLLTFLTPPVKGSIQGVVRV